MKTMAIYSGALLAVSLAIAALSAETPARRGRLNHVVAFKFKASATPEQIREVERAFGALQNQIPEIVSYEWGTNISPEKRNKGFTHGFVLTFNNARDRDIYLGHPAHQKFGKQIGPVLEDVFVIDFEANN